MPITETGCGVDVVVVVVDDGVSRLCNNDDRLAMKSEQTGLARFGLFTGAVVDDRFSRAKFGQPSFFHLFQISSRSSICFINFKNYSKIVFFNTIKF